MDEKPIVASPNFLFAAAALQKDAKSKLVRILWLLSRDFRHPSLQCKKVQGARQEVYECRVDQGIRLIYDFFNNMPRCLFVGEHDEALRFAVKATSPAFVVEVDDVVVLSEQPDQGESASAVRSESASEAQHMFTIQQLMQELNVISPALE